MGDPQRQTPWRAAIAVHQGACPRVEPRGLEPPDPHTARIWRLLFPSLACRSVVRWLFVRVRCCPPPWLLAWLLSHHIRAFRLPRSKPADRTITVSDQTCPATGAREAVLPSLPVLSVELNTRYWAPQPASGRAGTDATPGSAATHLDVVHLNLFYLAWISWFHHAAGRRWSPGGSCRSWSGRLISSKGSNDADQVRCPIRAPCTVDHRERQNSKHAAPYRRRLAGCGERGNHAAYAFPWGFVLTRRAFQNDVWRSARASPDRLTDLAL